MLKVSKILLINRVEGKRGFSHFYKYRFYGVLQEWSVNNRHDGGGGRLAVQYQQISTQSSSGQETVVPPHSAVGFVFIRSEFQT